MEKELDRRDVVSRSDGDYDASNGDQFTKSDPLDNDQSVAQQQQQHHPSHIWFSRRASEDKSPVRRASLIIHRAQPGRRWWKFTLRDWDDEDEQDWWFASTAIPLLAATIGPLANVFSIAALVTSWRMCLVAGVDAASCAWDGRSALLPDLEGQTLDDPRWCYWPNLVSLIVGFIGNFFLLCNFTNRIRYIVALPVTIVAWYVATGILIAITVSMETYVPPARPQQTYTQGFWYAVIAACMYCICSMILMVNMLGYFLGHYPQHFTLTESQRTLILQTMLFFIWLAGGGAVFSRVETDYGTQQQDWSYVNALYYCDVTILTVGFGDLYPSSDTGRGLVFPYSVLGIIMLGLMVSSITRFASELGSEKVIRRHVERSRARTVGRTVTTSMELEHRRAALAGARPVISAPFRLDDPAHTKFDRVGSTATAGMDPNRPPTRTSTAGPLQVLRKVATIGPRRRRTKTPRLILLREEKDRFDAMRAIQKSMAKFKRWYALSMSILAFGLLWCVGALVFYICERDAQDMTYFQALYFCYVSLLTIGYGDLSPKTNPGRPFFVFWSLIAVPTMTILVSDLGETVINKFKRGTFTVADFTVLPQRGVWRHFLERHPRLQRWLLARKQTHDARRRLEEGFPAGPAPELDPAAFFPPTLAQLAADRQPGPDELARRLPHAIKRTALDMKADPTKRYTYEEWVELTRLIRFTARSDAARDTADDDDADVEIAEGLIEWDWIGEDSPMMSQGSEAEFVMERLLESMNRYIRGRAAPARGGRGGAAGATRRTRRRLKTAGRDDDGVDDDGDDDVEARGDGVDQEPRTATSSGSDATATAEDTAQKGGSA